MRKKGWKTDLILTLHVVDWGLRPGALLEITAGDRLFSRLGFVMTGLWSLS